MPCVCAPALVALRNEVNALFLRRDKASDGCCGDEAHAARTSDHNPTGGYAHALDIDEDVEPGRDLLWLKPILLRDKRTKYVIYEGRIAYPDGTDKPYTGVNAHLHHLHLSILPTATFDKRRWLAAGTTPTTTEDDMPLNDADKAWIQAFIFDVVRKELNPQLAALAAKIDAIDGTPGPATGMVTGTFTGTVS